MNTINKKTIAFVVLSSLILGALGSQLYSRVILPKLAMIPFLVRHDIAPAPGPLVINTTQEVHVDNDSDTIAAIQRITPSTAAVLEKDSAGNVQAVGSGIVLTSDGLIATTKAVVGSQTQLWVKTIDGTTQAATIVATDPSSNVVFIQAALKNQSAVTFGNAEALQVGQPAVIVSQSNGVQQVEARIVYIASTAQDIPANTVFFSDQLNETFGITSEMNPIVAVPNQNFEGAAIAGSDGTVIGMYSKSGVITAGTIQSALNSYFNNNKQIIRSAIGIHYEFITPEISAITGMHQGVRVTKPDAKTAAVVAGSPAQQAGIQEGDVIMKVNDTQIDYQHSFESLVSSEAPNSVLTLELMRGGNDMVVTVVLKQAS
jgi:putative serine protease PepD